MPELVFPLDSSKPCTEQRFAEHNHWHLDIPAPVTLGDTFRVH